MADPATSLTATQGGFDTAALLQAIFTPQVPYSEWAARRRDGAELDTSKIEDAIRWAEAGIMFPVGDMIRETLALNPAATSFLGRAFTPIAMADWDVTQAEGDGLDEADAKRIANDVRAMLRGIRGFRQAIMHLAWGFSDGRAALEKEMVRTTSARPVGVSTRTVVTRLNRIEPQRLSFDDARRLIVVNRWGNSGRFIKQGPALDDIPGKFVQIMPSVFGDLQEREGLAIRFLFWLLFDRFQWRHRLQVMEKMGGPIGVLEQELANTMGAMKLPRDLGGEGGSPGDDAKSLDAALVAARAAMDRFGIFIGRPGEKFRFDWPPPEAHSLFSEGSDQILRHLEMLALHAALSSASTEQTRAGLVVLRTDQEILLDFRGALVAEAIQKDLVEPFVEMNYGPDALVYAPMFQLRTTPIRDRGAEVDRILKTAAAVPVGAGVLYEASGARPPNPGEPVIKPPAPSGPFGEGGAPSSGAAPAMPEEQSNDGQDAIGALRDLGEDADVDDQTDAADEEAGQVGAHLARWFADPGRKVMPATVHGSPEALVEAGTREGVRSTSQWADELVDAATGDDPARIYRNLAARAQTLNVEPFTRALERRLVHTLMLGALDADHEAVNDVEIKPATFDRMAFDGGVRDFTTLPFQEAIKAFSEKKVMSRRQFDRLAADAKKKAFTVAGLTTQRMLETAHDELRKAMIPGADLRDFSKKLGERFDAAGWTRLNPSHVENVFRTNVMGAYGDGRRAQMTQPHVMAARPYWQILGVDDARTRKTHAAAHGKVLPANDPFFQNSGPPFGWACRCRIISRSKKDLDRLGLTPTFGAALKGLPDPGWNADAIAPPASWEVQDGPPPAAAAPPTKAEIDITKPYPGFDNIEDAQRWAAAKHPHVEWDLAGVHIDAANASVGELDLLADEHPEAFKLIRSVSTALPPVMPEHSANAIATWIPTDGRIWLNPEMFGDAAALKRTLKQNAEIHWTVGGEIADVVSHEFGHVVDSWLTGRHALPFTGLTPGPMFNDAARSLAVANPVSAYAMTDGKEAFAEAFAEMWRSSPTGWKEPFKWLLDTAKNREAAPIAYWREPAGPARKSAIQSISAFVKKWNGFGLPPIALDKIVEKKDIDFYLKDEP